MPDERAAMEVLGESGWTLLVEAAQTHDAAQGDALAAAAALAKRRPDAPAARRAAALELVTEGAKLAAKLGLPGERFVAVRGAVEQATSGRVATWHAQELPEDVRVVEIGCGCGGDSLAIAHRVRNLIAVDADPVRAACTHMNLAALGLSNARAVPGDGFEVLAADGADADVVFVDPDRRPGGERTLDPEAWRPPLSRIAEFARGGRRVLVKAAPSLDVEGLLATFRVAFVSHGGECVECLLDSGGEPSGPPARNRADLRASRRSHSEASMRPPRVRAVLLPADGPSVELAGDRGDAPEGDLGTHLLVPDPAAVRARLLRELCVRHDLRLVDGQIALLTGPAPAASPWLRAYEVLGTSGLEEVPARLRSLGPSEVRVHTRGVAASAPDLERAWRSAIVRGGGGPVVDVFATRLRGRVAGVLARPCSAT